MGVLENEKWLGGFCRPQPKLPKKERRGFDGRRNIWKPALRLLYQIQKNWLNIHPVYVKNLAVVIIVLAVMETACI